MKISIVIPVYNGRDVIFDCIKSILKSEIEYDHEVIIIDDYSSDNSFNLLREKHPTLTIERNPVNKGFAYSVNRGIQLAKGDLICLLNQDTILFPDTIDILTKKLISEKSAGIIAPQLLNMDGSPQKSIRRFPKHSDIVYHHLGFTCLFPDNPEYNRWKMPDFDYDLEQYVDQPAFSAVIIRSQVISQVGLLDESFPLFFNDVDYCKCVIEAGWKILYYPSAKVKHYHGHATKKHAIISIYLSHAAFINYLRKHFRGGRYVVLNFVCSLLLVTSSHVRAILALFGKKTIS